MSGPILALRAAILRAAQADVPLAVLMGGTARLFDEPPRSAQPVYALFCDVTARDVPADGARSHEQEGTLVVFAKEGSARTALDVADRLAALIDDAPLVLDGHHLVDLAVTTIAATRDEKTNLTRVTLTFRAFTDVK
jgi:hypothetical protein